MSTPYHHSLSSVKRWGGAVEDYLPLHQWFDASKAFHGDFRHRALRHHAEGIFALEKEFGVTIATTSGRVVPVRLIGEQHVVEDLGFIPCLSQWLAAIKPQAWMNRVQKAVGEAKLSEARDAYGAPLEPVQVSDTAEARSPSSET